MRLTYTVAPQLSEDTAQLNSVFGPLAGETDTIVDTMQNENSGRLAIKAGTTQSLSFGTLNVALGFYLRMDNDCKVAINGNAPLQLFRASQATGVKARLFFEGTITSLAVTAPSDGPAYGIYAIWGDPVDDGDRTANLPLVLGAPGSVTPVLNQVLSGTAAPTSDQGEDGDSFIDTVALVIYGPKEDGAWPVPGRSLETAAAPNATIYEGTGAPDLSAYPQAAAGDLYLDTDSDILYELSPQTQGS